MFITPKIWCFIELPSNIKEQSVGLGGQVFNQGSLFLSVCVPDALCAFLLQQREPSSRLRSCSVTDAVAEQAHLPPVTHTRFQPPVGSLGFYLKSSELPRKSFSCAKSTYRTHETLKCPSRLPKESGFPIQRVVTATEVSEMLKTPLLCFSIQVNANSDMPTWSKH